MAALPGVAIFGSSPQTLRLDMPNPWTGKGNPYTRKEVCERLRATLKKGQPIIAAGAGTGISAKFIEKGGADLIIIYNSGRFRMAGHGSTCGLMAYGDANAVAMEIGEFEVCLLYTSDAADERSS